MTADEIARAAARHRRAAAARRRRDRRGAGRRAMRGRADRSAPHVPRGRCAPAARSIDLAYREHAREASAARGAVRHLRLDGRLHAPVPALPARAHRCAAARAHLPVRHAADQRDALAEAAAIPTRRWRAARRRCRTGRAARASPHACTSSTATGRGACWGRAPSCCCSPTGWSATATRDLPTRDGPAAPLLPAAGLAQPAAALRRVRGAGAGHPGHAAACRRVPADPQSRLDGRAGRRRWRRTRRARPIRALAEAGGAEAGSRGEAGRAGQRAAVR